MFLGLLGSPWEVEKDEEKKDALAELHLSEKQELRGKMETVESPVMFYNTFFPILTFCPKYAQ